MQAAYKIKEFRELTKMENCNVMLNLVYESQSMFSDELMVKFILIHLKIVDMWHILNIFYLILITGNI